MEDKDELLDEVIKFVRTTKKVSCLAIQDKFKIGYNRAGRIVDQLEDLFIISPFKGDKERYVYCSCKSQELIWNDESICLECGHKYKCNQYK